MLKDKLLFPDLLERVRVYVGLLKDLLELAGGEGVAPRGTASRSRGKVLGGEWGGGEGVDTAGLVCLLAGVS